MFQSSLYYCKYISFGGLEKQLSIKFLFGYQNLLEVVVVYIILFRHFKWGLFHFRPVISLARLYRSIRLLLSYKSTSDLLKEKLK